MLHWVQAATPALRFYREAFGKGQREAEKTFEVYVSSPTGVSMYKKEQLNVRYRSRFGVLPPPFGPGFCSACAPCPLPQRVTDQISSVPRIGLRRLQTSSSGGSMVEVVNSLLWSGPMHSSRICRSSSAVPWCKERLQSEAGISCVGNSYGRCGWEAMAIRLLLNHLSH